MPEKIAFLLSDNLIAGDAQALRDDIFECEEEIASLSPAFAACDMILEPVRWREIAQKAKNHAAILPLMVWDYFEGHEADFMQAMQIASTQSLLLNPYEVLKWNSNKAYLDDLAQRGAPVIDSLTVDKVTIEAIEAGFAQFATDRLVIKPEIGGGAWRQVLLHRDEPLPSKELLPPGRAILQPFMKNVQKEGEYSFLYFDGQYSHAVLKQAKSGDYRIQSIYGGTEKSYAASAKDQLAAQAVLDVLDFTPLYARIDLLRADDESLRLIEIEMIEPYLYLPHAKIDENGLNHGAMQLARAVRSRLENQKF